MRRGRQDGSVSEVHSKRDDDREDIATRAVALGCDTTGVNVLRAIRS
jgi:hypothetical protein